MGRDGTPAIGDSWSEGAAALLAFHPGAGQFGSRPVHTVNRSALGTGDARGFDGLLQLELLPAPGKLGQCFKSLEQLVDALVSLFGRFLQAFQNNVLKRLGDLRVFERDAGRLLVHV